MRTSWSFVPLAVLAMGCASEPQMNVRLGEQPLNVQDHYRIHDRPYGAPAYQAPFREASHRAPTVASRRAAERQMRELVALLVGRTSGPDTLRGYLDLPDGRFSESFPKERRAILAIDGYVDPEVAIARCDIYAGATFRDATGRRIENPRPEIWYALGDGKLRKIHPSEIRYERRGDRVRERLPGQAGYVAARYRTPEEAFGMPASAVPDRWNPSPDPG